MSLLASAMQNVDPLSLSGSGAALVATFYFWLVRANRERPRLETHLVNKMLMHQRTNEEKGVVHNTIHARVGVANYSIMPNAIIAVTAEVKRVDGTWGLCDVEYTTDLQFFTAGSGNVSQAIGERLQTELPDPPPYNLSPMQTCPLPLRLYHDAPVGMDKSGNNDPIARPFQVRLTIHALSHQRFKTEISNDKGPWTDIEEARKRAEEGAKASAS